MRCVNALAAAPANLPDILAMFAAPGVPQTPEFFNVINAIFGSDDPAPVEPRRTKEFSAAALADSLIRSMLVQPSVSVSPSSSPSLPPAGATFATLGKRAKQPAAKPAQDNSAQPPAAAQNSVIANLISPVLPIPVQTAADDPSVCENRTIRSLPLAAQWPNMPSTVDPDPRARTTGPRAPISIFDTARPQPAVSEVPFPDGLAVTAKESSCSAPASGGDAMALQVVPVRGTAAVQPQEKAAPTDPAPKPATTGPAEAAQPQEVAARDDYEPIAPSSRTGFPSRFAAGKMPEMVLRSMGFAGAMIARKAAPPATTIDLRAALAEQPITNPATDAVAEQQTLPLLTSDPEWVLPPMPISLAQDLAQVAFGAKVTPAQTNSSGPPPINVPKATPGDAPEPSPTRTEPQSIPQAPARFAQEAFVPRTPAATRVAAAAATATITDPLRSFDAPQMRDAISTQPRSETPFRAVADALRTWEPSASQPDPFVARVTTLQQIALKIEQPQAPPVELRVAERAGEIHVSVRTPDASLQTSLRQDLGALSSSLERAGFRAETFVPREAIAQTPRMSQNNFRNDREPQSAFSGRNGSGDSGERRNQQRDRQPSKWIEELENVK